MGMTPKTSSLVSSTEVQELYSTSTQPGCADIVLLKALKQQSGPTYLLVMPFRLKREEKQRLDLISLL